MQVFLVKHLAELVFRRVSVIQPREQQARHLTQIQNQNQAQHQNQDPQQILHHLIVITVTVITVIVTAIA